MTQARASLNRHDIKHPRTDFRTRDVVNQAIASIPTVGLFARPALGLFARPGDPASFRHAELWLLLRAGTRPPGPRFLAYRAGAANTPVS